ncbi:TrmO family methyltransferase [Paenactinomyces guangxiensis]|uniref:TrmO family methyltransferase domain-containing protein n=1 Tax=Paenactinomyces guangxiensis TaxID=1490290 RepID=UPI0018DB0559|nr:SAM-dependent methyltransferase [Paenactinomyces guangxiensis]
MYKNRYSATTQSGGLVQSGYFCPESQSAPNQVGVSRCRLLSVEGLTLTVKGLDAIDQTPVLDIKPYMVELDPSTPFPNRIGPPSLCEIIIVRRKAPFIEHSERRISAVRETWYLCAGSISA